MGRWQRFLVELASHCHSKPGAAVATAGTLTTASDGGSVDAESVLVTAAGATAAQTVASMAVDVEDGVIFVARGAIMCSNSDLDNKDESSCRELAAPASGHQGQV